MPWCRTRFASTRLLSAERLSSLHFGSLDAATQNAFGYCCLSRRAAGLRTLNTSSIFSPRHASMHTLAPTLRSPSSTLPASGFQHGGAGAKVWLLLALRLILMRPTPTLFLAGEKRLREARLLSALWPMTDPVVFLTMDN